MDPKNLRFATTHEWAHLEGDVCTVGITKFAVEQLTDVVYIELPDLQDNVFAGDSFGEIESVIQQKIDQNRGKVRVAADLSRQGIAEIEAEERMQNVLAEQALSDFEVELGLKSPDTAPMSKTAKDLGPAAVENAKATDTQTS